MKLKQYLIGLSFTSVSALTVAAPMPNAIVVEDKAVVPVLKSEVIKKVEGQEPVRDVQATIFEVTNKGKDVVAREVEFQDNQQFSDKQLAIPVVKKGGVIVPTSKIELNTALKQDGKVVAEAKKIDAEGYEFKKGQEPIKRTLQVGEAKNNENNSKVSRVVQTANGEKTRDLIIVDENK